MFASLLGIYTADFSFKEVAIFHLYSDPNSLSISMLSSPDAVKYSHNLECQFPCYNIDTMADKKILPAGSSFWHIFVPFILGTIVTLFLAIWIVLRVSAGNISRFAEISTVLLVIPVVFFSLIFLVVLVGLIVLVIRIIQGLPLISSRILEYINKFRDLIVKISDIIVKPIINPAAILGGFRSLLFRKKTRFKIE